jgi:hypothetical protein
VGTAGSADQAAVAVQSSAIANNKRLILRITSSFVQSTLDGCGGMRDPTSGLSLKKSRVVYTLAAQRAHPAPQVNLCNLVGSTCAAINSEPPVNFVHWSVNPHPAGSCEGRRLSAYLASWPNCNRYPLLS